ncbi:hypothetical protein Cylst_2094 [Cylindrospermum stagnale PCC 7417]|uniref:DUF4168 domain-containing protein n=1 Tax=Cylindrospermum stagnale PCC 7417 TaxID=56107 RepID=K9WVU1_9NOST|nr:hypothetical protein [Cylindrospermum stagnale]AFZ24333.1 hypothetical protein Cylst_2094 [Cylindrospermum stagnale PCC 7417]
MNLKKLRRCGYLLTLLASTVPSVVFGQAALATSTNEFFKPLEPSNTSVNCSCPRPYPPTFNKKSKPFITERYCPDFGGRFQNKIPRQCPLYLKPSINSTSVTQPIIFAKKEADEGRRISTPGETLKQGLRDEAQTELNRGNDATANLLYNMSDRLNTGNISEPEASDIAREVATGNFDRAANLVDRSSRN